MVESGEIEEAVEKPRPLYCLIRSVRDRANKWCVVSSPVGAAIANAFVQNDPDQPCPLYYPRKRGDV